MDPLTFIATAAGLGWTSGVRLYAVLFFLGVLHHAGLYTLPPNLEVLAHPVVMAVSGALFVTEFFADKVPGVDSAWDAVHTFIRIPGGALLAAAAVANSDPGLALAAGLLGGVAAAGTHFTKAGSRALINASPEPFSNWAVSLGEDFAAPLALFAALKHPLLFLILLVLFLALMIWLLPKVWRGIRRILVTLRRLPPRFTGGRAQKALRAMGPEGAAGVPPQAVWRQRNPRTRKEPCPPDRSQKTIRTCARSVRAADRATPLPDREALGADSRFRSS
jgi:hypothetical protein